MTTDGEVILHGFAVKCDVAPSLTMRHSKILNPVFVDPWSKKIRSPCSLARNLLTRDLSVLGFVELQIGHVFHYMLIDVIKLSRNIQVICLFLNSAVKHVVMFHFK